MPSAGTQIISLPVLLNLPLKLSNLLPYITLEQFHRLRFPVLSSIYTRSPDSDDDKFRALWHQSKLTLGFSLSASSPSTTIFLFGTWGFRASLKLWTFVLSFLFIRSSAGKYTMESGVDLYTCLSLVKPSWPLPLVQPLHYSFDNMGCWLCGEADTLLRAYGINWTQIATHYS